MKHLYKLILFVVVSIAVASCADNDPFDFNVEKPESVALQEAINAYGSLKSYRDKDANPDFKLGAGISISDYNSQGVMYRLINSNFDEVTAGYGMKHGAVVQADGSLALDNVEALLNMTSAAGISVYGHTLCWHANQNAEYLNSTIAPTVIPGEPSWDLVTGADFETDDASNYESNANAVMSFTAVGEGANGEGRALKINNAEVRANDWDAQFFITFDPATVVGEKYTLTMDIRADDAASFPTQAHIVPYTYKHYDFFGAINATTEWTTFSKEITITDNTSEVTAIAFNLGATATNYYFDNVKLTKYNEGGGGPALEASVITNTDFESGDAGWGGWGNGSTRAVSAEGEGYGGTGYAYTFTNPAVVNFWEAQVAYDLSPLEMGSTYQLNFKVKANAAGAIRAEVQSSADYSSDPLGTFDISEEWKEYTLEATMTKEDRNRFIISYGDFAGTVYIDDITLRRINPDGNGGIEKTPEEKKEIIAGELERWIAGMMEVSKEYVKAWDVVNEPMDDGSPYELKTGMGRELNADEFYWQDYLGKDYAVKAFQLARQYGNPDDILFINDYNLEYNLDKCRGLIEYVKYIESQGATVDGIGTQMHISTDSDKEKIAEMFELLAATGKLIKISELDIGVGVTTPEATDEHYQAQAEMYQYVVEKYFELIPAAQRYGITVWSPLDSPEGSSWRGNEPIGLWTLGYDRKPAYTGFADGLGELKQ